MAIQNTITAPAASQGETLIWDLIKALQDAEAKYCALVDANASQEEIDAADHAQMTAAVHVVARGRKSQEYARQRLQEFIHTLAEDHDAVVLFALPEAYFAPIAAAFAAEVA